MYSSFLKATRLVRFNYAQVGRGGRIRTLKTSFGEKQFTVELTPLGPLSLGLFVNGVLFAEFAELFQFQLILYSF